MPNSWDFRSEARHRYVAAGALGVVGVRLLTTGHLYTGWALAGTSCLVALPAVLGWAADLAADCLRIAGASLGRGRAGAAGHVCRTSPIALVVDSERHRKAYVPILQAAWTDDACTVEVLGEGALAFLGGLVPGGRAAISAHGRVAVGTVANSERLRRNGADHWRIALRGHSSQFIPDLEMGLGDLSRDRVAELRARRILLNDPPPPPETLSGSNTDQLNLALREIFIAGRETPISVTESPFPALFRSLAPNPERFLQCAWAEAAYYLILSGAVASIETLELRLNGEVLACRMVGLRNRRYANVPPYEVRVEGAQVLGDGRPGASKGR